MVRIVTEADTWKTTMRLKLALDGDVYHNQFQCIEYPELTRVDTGPASQQSTGREPLGPHTRTYYVAGEPVERNAAAMAAAINAHRAKKEAGEK